MLDEIAKHGNVISYGSPEENPQRVIDALSNGNNERVSLIRERAATLRDRAYTMKDKETIGGDQLQLLTFTPYLDLYLPHVTCPFTCLHRRPHTIAKCRPGLPRTRLQLPASSDQSGCVRGQFRPIQREHPPYRMGYSAYEADSGETRYFGHGSTPLLRYKYSTSHLLMS